MNDTTMTGSGDTGAAPVTGTSPIRGPVRALRANVSAATGDPERMLRKGLRAITAAGRDAATDREVRCRA